MLEVEELGTRPVLARGVVEYQPGADHPSEIHTVEFIVSNVKKRLLRQVGEDAEQFDTNSWRFNSKKDDDTLNPVEIGNDHCSAMHLGTTRVYTLSTVVYSTFILV